MTNQIERRSRLMGLKIKQEAWDLEDYKKRNWKAKEAEDSAQQALAQVEGAISDTENSMRQVLNGAVNLELDVIQAARYFLRDQQENRKRCQQEKHRATQKATQAEDQLKQEVLYLKALRKIKASSDQEINRAHENAMAEQLAELWLQRYGRD